MKKIHFFEDQFYVVSNSSCAKNALFRTRKDVEDFQSRIDDYLGSICDVMAYNFKPEEFVLLIRMKSESEIYKFYEENEKSQRKDDKLPPVTYILSQQMANMQSGYVKHYNHKYRRNGGLFCDRFKRKLLKSKEEVEYWVKEINEMAEFRPRTIYWRSKEFLKNRKSRKDYSLDELYSSKRLDKARETSVLKCFKRMNSNYLRGCNFKKLKFRLSKAQIGNFFISKLQNSIIIQG